MNQVNTQTKNIPKLRFPEFSDEWRQTSFMEIAGKGKYGMNSAAKSYDGKNKYLRITDIDDETGWFLKDGLTSPAGSLQDEYLLKNGDFVLARTGASTGKTYLYKDGDDRVYFAGFLIRFRVKDANPYFVYSQTLRKNYEKWVALTSARSGQPGINADEFGKYKFYIPQIEEQRKIASFITLVDERISGMQKKLELLKKYKKGVMQKIFSQEIRFKDENGKNFPDWEEKKLGDIAKFSKGVNISKDDIVPDGKTEAIRYGELYTTYNEVVNDVKSRTNLDPKSLVLSKKNDVVIPASGETHIDIATASCILKDGVALSGDINIIRSENNGIFLSYYLNNAKKIEIAKRAQGVSVIHLYSTNLKDLKLILPALGEQQKIAKFLTAIDDKVQVEERRLAEAKKFKKSLLQQMFV